MKRKFYILLGFVALITTSLAFKAPKESKSLKCLVQLTNYEGEGAYMVISLINPEGKYERTLHVIGEDEQWYHDLTEWWSFYQTNDQKIDGTSSATIAGGERTVCLIEVDTDKIDAGYKLRFETAVEGQKYYVDDLEFPLTTENTTSKFEGKGYIRYIRIMPA